MNRRRRFPLILLAAALLFAAAACSRTAPEISYGFIELVYYQEPEGPREQYSFFVIPSTSEGIEDLAEIYLYNDAAELRWKLTSEDWLTYDNEGTIWVGTRAVAMPGREPLPRGEFRAVIFNKGGEKSEKIFSFDAPIDSRYPFPFLEFVSGSYRVDSRYPKNSLVCFDGQGNYLSTVELETLTGLVSDLGLPADTRSAALWAEDQEMSTSAFTDAARIR